MLYTCSNITDTLYEDDVFEISKKLCEKVLKILQTKTGVIIDHVITSERVYMQLQEMCSSYPIHCVKVTCPVEVLRKREQDRKNRCIGSAEASLQYLYPKDEYELVVDTYENSSEECAVHIIENVWV